MRVLKIGKLAAAIGCSLMAVNAGWAAIQIQVSESGNSVGMSSYAYQGDAVVASSGWAGSWNALMKTGPGGPPVNYTFTAFCTDLGNVMNPGTYSYEPLAFSSADLSSPEGTPPDPNWANGASGGRAAWLYNTYLGAVNTGGLLDPDGAGPLGNVSQAQRRSAMAIGIWELLYENVETTGYSVKARQSTGTGTKSFYATASSGNSVVLDLADYWIGEGEDAAFAGYDMTWFAEQWNPDVQSLVGPYNAPIPEPTTVIAGALLLLPFGASAIRIIRKNQTV